MNMGVPVNELFFSGRRQHRHGLTSTLLVLDFLQQLLSQHQMLLVTPAAGVAHALKERLSVVLHRVECVHPYVRSMR